MSVLKQNALVSLIEKMERNENQADAWPREDHDKPAVALEARSEFVDDSFADNVSTSLATVVNQSNWNQILDCGTGVAACEADQALDVLGVESHHKRRNYRHQRESHVPNKVVLRVQLVLIDKQRL